MYIFQVRPPVRVVACTLPSSSISAVSPQNHRSRPRQQEVPAQKTKPKLLSSGGSRNSHHDILSIFRGACRTKGYRWLYYNYARTIINNNNQKNTTLKQ